MNKNNFIISTNPGKNYEILGKVKISSEREIKEKTEQAQNAKAKWKNLGIEGRSNYLKEIFKKIDQQRKEIALLVTKEVGMPISQSLLEIEKALKYFEWYLDNAQKYLSPETTFEDKRIIHKVFYEPVGTVVVITSWNYPIANFVWGVIQNLIVGNTVIFKHSEECPLSGKMMEKIVNSCRLPVGVFSELYGDGEIGELIVRGNIDLIWFTGSSQVGKYLYQKGAEKFIKVSLEIGGSAPGIILKDVNVDRILEYLYTGRFTNCGQVCDGLKRLIVHKDRYNEVIEKLKVLIESKRLGNPEDETVDIGPLVAKKQLSLLKSQVQEALHKGAKIITGGKQPFRLKGAYYEPTLLTRVTTRMRVWQEEVFGPVLPVVSFKTEKEAIKLANNTKYGLGSYIFTEDKEKALKIASEIEAGMVSINNVCHLNPRSPFGRHKESGMGREHGKYGLHELTQIKVLSVKK